MPSDAPPAGFSVRYPSGIAPFQSYRTPLRQVLQNLVGNAIKYHDRDDAYAFNIAGFVCESRIGTDRSGFARMLLDDWSKVGSPA